MEKEAIGQFQATVTKQFVFLNYHLSCCMENKVENDKIIRDETSQEITAVLQIKKMIVICTRNEAQKWTIHVFVR